MKQSTSGVKTVYQHSFLLSDLKYYRSDPPVNRSNGNKNNVANNNLFS